MTACRYCTSAGMGDGAHVHGERKCCPDCDHRPDDYEAEVAFWARLAELMEEFE